MSVVIRPVRPEDLPTLLEIEHASFSSPRWKAPDFLQNDCVVAELDGKIAGFLVSREIYSSDSQYAAEREILNLAVATPFRRLGIATALLSHELNLAREVFLEVRESNTGAQTLYRKLGFREVGRRENYYESPAERAIVMKMKWC
jgi:ribosomal-protein-alanine N-acetyltransferase